MYWSKICIIWFYHHIPRLSAATWTRPPLPPPFGRQLIYGWPYTIGDHPYINDAKFGNCLPLIPIHFVKTPLPTPCQEMLLAPIFFNANHILRHFSMIHVYFLLCVILAINIIFNFFLNIHLKTNWQFVGLKKCITGLKYA